MFIFIQIIIKAKIPVNLLVHYNLPLLYTIENGCFFFREFTNELLFDTLLTFGFMRSGYAISLVAESTTGTLISTELANIQGKLPEDIGTAAANLLLKE